MIFTETNLDGCFIVEPEPFADDRGWFARYFDGDDFRRIGFGKHWVQMNHSFTKEKGTLRGMHYQVAPHREVKLVRCIAGCIYDVVIDLREDSPTFLQYMAVELSADNKKMLYIPEGFAHGFQALSDNCELLYHHSAYYMPTAEAGIRYNDELIDIDWPILPVPVISERDRQHPMLDKNFKGI